MTSPADWLPSPQSIMTAPAAAKSDKGAFGLASVNVATCPEKAVPSVVVIGVPVGVRPASAMVNVLEPLVPPPGVGLNTVTLAVPSSVKSAAGIIAWRCELSEKLVANAVPFHCTTEVAENPDPMTVMERFPLPSTTDV